MKAGPTSHHFISQRLHLHYVDWGNTEAPPLLLVHGARDHCRSWDWVAQELSKDWHVIAPDLRGHGDSQRSPEGHYSIMAYVYDLAQLIHQRKLAPVTIICHSLGGAITLRYAGLYPENVKKIVAIEGVGASPDILKVIESEPTDDRLRQWINDKRALASRVPKCYDSLEEAYSRMKAENRHLSDEQAYHLTAQGTRQNEDGTYSWKFDNYVRIWAPFDISQEESDNIWRSINCPVLMLHGEDSWDTNPAKDGRIKHFKDAKSIVYDHAGHWLHHDQFNRFIKDVRAFI